MTCLRRQEWKLGVSFTKYRIEIIVISSRKTATYFAGAKIGLLLPRRSRAAGCAIFSFETNDNLYSIYVSSILIA